MSATQQTARVALLTGMAQGIGAATARLFAERGYTVAALDKLAAGEQVCDEIRQAGGSCHFYRCNIVDEASVQATVADIDARFGRIDTLLNVAGIVLVKPLLETIQTQRTVNTYWHLDVSAHSACPDKRQRVISIAVIEDIVKKTITSAVLSHIIARN